MSKTVKEILEAYNDNYLSKYDPRFGRKIPSEKEVPNVIVLRRKAIRIYPDAQRIALYYSPQLDKYVSIPYGPGTQASGIQISEAKKSDDYEFHKDVPPELRYLYTSHFPKKGQKRVVTTKDILRDAPFHQVAKYSPKEAFKRSIRDSGGDPVVAAGLATAAGIRGVQKGIRSLMSRFGSKSSTPTSTSSTSSPAPSTPAPTSTKKPTIRKRPPASVRKKILANPDQPVVKSALQHAGLPIKEEYLIQEEFRLFEERAPNLTEEQQLQEIYGLIAKYGLKKALQYAGKYGQRLLKKGAKKTIATGKKAKDWVKSKVGSAAAGAAANKALSDDDENAEEKPSTSSSTRDTATAPQTQYSNRAGRFLDTDIIKNPNVISQQDFSQMFGSYGARQSANRQAQVMRESTNFDKVKLIVENNIKTDTLIFGDNSITINNRIAKKVINLYESLNKDNKKKIEEMLDENANSFKKIINFAIRQ